MSPDPYVVAHRGYKDKYPENTMSSFEGAAAIGVDMIETDLQVTKDGILVLNHDPSTGRNFDEDLVIADTNFDALKALRNKQDPDESLPSFKELLIWLVEKRGTSKLMLDVKPYHQVCILAKIIRELLDVNDDLGFWQGKIIFGLWSLPFLDLAIDTGLLNNFEIINITVSPTGALKFLERSLDANDPRIVLKGVSLLFVSLLSGEFPDVHKKLKEHNVDLYTWTSNTEDSFKLSYEYNARGIVTDKPLELQAFIRQHPSGATLSKYIPPSLFTKEGVQISIRYCFFRLLEFIHSRNLMSYAIVRYALGILIKTVS